MPEKCRVMTEEEMEYEGGFLNFIAAAVCTVASIGCSAAASLTGCKELEYASWDLAAAGVVSSAGVTACVSAASRTATTVVVKNTVKQAVVNAGNKVGTLGGAITAEDYAIASKVLKYTLDTPLEGVSVAHKVYSHRIEVMHT